jgi:hypothetical protein
LFVAVGLFSNVLSSADGTNWTSSLGVLSRMSAIAYGSGRFVAVGPGTAGTVVSETSTDGTNWATTPGSLNGSLNGVAYGNGLFVAVGVTNGPTSSPGEVYTSPDGVGWTAVPSLPVTSTLNAVTYAHGVFVAVGQLQSATLETAALLTSADGTHWTLRDCGAFGNLVAVAYGSSDVSQFLAVGGSGLILGCTLSVGLPLIYSPTTGVRLPVQDLPFGRLLQVQVSRDLINWASLSNFVLSRGGPTLQVFDPAATNYSKSFYSIGLR